MGVRPRKVSCELANAVINQLKEKDKSRVCLVGWVFV